MQKNNKGNENKIGNVLENVEINLTTDNSMSKMEKQLEMKMALYDK